jgi:hypothetical protein
MKYEPKSLKAAINNQKFSIGGFKSHSVLLGNFL